jgi:hypothetical protein
MPLSAIREHFADRKMPLRMHDAQDATPRPLANASTHMYRHLREKNTR